MEKISIKEFTAARLLIEKGILDEAMENVTDEDIRDLQRNLAKSKELIAMGKLATDVNIEFHSLLARASKNTIYALLKEPLTPCILICVSEGLETSSSIKQPSERMSSSWRLL